MGIVKGFFTWWEGATFGTWLWSRRNGARVGEDGHGNVYFETKTGRRGPSRRWVMYAGSNDASRVPAEWFTWLHHTADRPPTEMPPPRVWEKPTLPNQTGTGSAYRPQGALEQGGRRAAATGDYEAWEPS